MLDASLYLTFRVSTMLHLIHVLDNSRLSSTPIYPATNAVNVIVTL